ncbi:cryptochrome/photolyase family protein [Legionella brunensis]|uniref:Deoxyribodipyrimidine photo-lyase n=1 Tax=Legionella brunensis TaxID=29422 RepID=A0A0W0SP85_9GAMM|nr:deoxyribodipyrimidine photo-lyase [Legionella brunensis]KTC85057.1 deoxyribodipyrimidine photolyase [Legionella brunensis]
MSIALVWFRQDLRCQDNPALAAACQNHKGVIPLYIADEKPAKTVGAAQGWWLHHSLLSLKKDLESHGLNLCLRHGLAWPQLFTLIKQYKIEAVYWNRCYEPEKITRDKAIKAQLKNLGVKVFSFNASLLIEPWEVTTSNQSYFKVFTPFWRQCLKKIELPAPISINQWPCCPPFEVFLAELGWREFSYHLLYHFPSLHEENFKQDFNQFSWRNDEDVLLKWQQGLTGFPIVDAGMRELWRTGYMHNRVRMIVASFLVKDLLIDWRKGAAWFLDTLVDADLANNSASWQWVAGSGADAAPYFRIFNPVLQGEKFDAQGEYIRRWVPELASVSSQWIHKPWKAPNKLGITLGKDYPYPIVDHDEARHRALAVYQALKKVR